MKLLTFLFSLCLVVPAMAQQKTTNDIEMKGTPVGVYIDLGLTAKNTGYKVYRKEKGSDYQPIEVSSPCATSSDLYRRMVHYAAVFTNYAPPSRAFADTLWSRYQADVEVNLSLIPYPLLQLALGNAFLDTSAVMGQTYQYQFKSDDTSSVSESVAFTYTLFHPEFAEMKLSRALPGRNTVQIEWMTFHAGKAPFFQVFRKQSAGRTGFEKINPVRGLRSNATGDSAIFMIIDSTVISGLSYDYYIAAQGFLGNLGNHSDTVRLQVGARQNVPAIFAFHTRSDSNGILLEWQPLPSNPSLQNILVLRSANYDSGYTLLTTLPVSDSTYSDRYIVAGKRYYYQLIVQGTSNYSLPTPRVAGVYTGKVRLLPPSDVTARSVDGGVKLSWRYGNQEKIVGFKVFRSLSSQRGLKQIGHLIPKTKDTSQVQFIDTTVLSDKVTYYYRVAAVSHTTSLSPMSEMVSSIPAGITEIPTPTSLRALWLNDSVVSVTWTDLQRQTSGIAGYKVFKNKTELQKPSQQELFHYTFMNEFRDTLQPGESSWYWVKTVNVHEDVSAASMPVHLQAPIDKPLPPGKVRAYKQESAVVLQWDPSLNKSIEKYNIYRAENTGDIQLLGSIGANQEILNYRDTNVKSGQLYFYYVTSVSGYEIESRHSPEVHVRLE